MGWTKIKIALVVTGAALLITIVSIIVTTTGNSASRYPSKSVPKFRLPRGQIVPAIRLGTGHGVILASDGSIWSWGENADGWPVLGLGKVTNQTSLHRIGNETDWISIAVGSHHNLALKSDGTLWGWGENIYGELGDGTSGRSDAWRSTPIRSAPGNGWKQAAVGGSHSVALKKDGTLWAWGNNWAGQLGIGSTNRVVSEAVQVGSATNWVKVWAGLLETVAQQSDGSLWFWGDNPDPAIPQSGPGASNILSPTRVSTDTNWVDVGFGPWTVLAIKSEGTLWAWGRQAHVFTGVENQTLDATPVQVGTNVDWRAISAFGWFYQLLLKKDGALWSLWAETGSSPKPLRVTRVNLTNDIVAFDSVGRGHPVGVVLTRDGEVWTWGRVLAEHTPAYPSLQAIAKLAQRLHLGVDWGNSRPVTRQDPWQINKLDPEPPTTK